MPTTDDRWKLIVTHVERCRRRYFIADCSWSSSNEIVTGLWLHRLTFDITFVQLLPGTNGSD
ncbi:MAG: hypothetical protein ACLVL2_11940 [Bacteroides cellulosilyticus]